ncbi:MAG: GAF domain-containing protein [Alphaproteobacteria bacterium]|nr:GAF domain-containing protein [Alphaproteobacteria bacterium]
MAENEEVELSAQDLNKLLAIWKTLSDEKDTDVLLENILTTARDFANAEGGTLYLMDSIEEQLTFSIIQNERLGTKMGGTSDIKKIPFPPLYLYNQETGKPNHSNISTYAALTGEIVNVADAYDSTKFDFSGTKKFDETSGYHSKSFLCVPLKTAMGQVVAVLQLINARSKDGSTVAFSPFVQKMVESLASGAAVALNNKLLLESQRKVLEAFVSVLASAIDKKSPYTAMHSQRVPVIASMLLSAALTDDNSTFRDLDISEDDMYSLNLAAWLHDCGKIMTPEYVLNKSTKLEAMTNRIHEIRTRFEVLRRDAHIDYLKKRLANTAPAEKLATEFQAKVKKLEADFAFLAEVNQDTRPLNYEDIGRIQKISQQTYCRYFDKTLGLSYDEQQRVDKLKIPKVNPKERLLEDAPEQIYGGFNHGEVHNLSISKGTLTAEEQKKVNAHIDETISMLQQIPFPDNTRNIVEYASCHHEHVDGTGYPNHLTKDQMSVPARILCVADVYETLSSTDCPYKKMKPLSQIIAIMSDMAKSGHLDPDLFNLFLKSGVYKDYASVHLKDEQIDDFNIETFLVPTLS